ncbi:hypothetical protein C1X73_11120 [Pseudomonas sp. FW305-130]|nr:hypothetical protein C1X74_07590 [Pseudomonas sp. GW460-5]PNB59403.1 hypothetical protein C1X73_11120 [Pseudomonas sp. FW305-130]
MVPAQCVRSEMHQGQQQQPVDSTPPGQPWLPFVVCSAPHITKQEVGQPNPKDRKAIIFNTLRCIVKCDFKKRPHSWVISTQEPLISCISTC